VSLLKDVNASYDMVVKHFERIQLFLQRLDRYARVPLTTENNRIAREGHGADSFDTCAVDQGNEGEANK